MPTGSPSALSPWDTLQWPMGSIPPATSHMLVCQLIKHQGPLGPFQLSSPPCSWSNMRHGYVSDWRHTPEAHPYHPEFKSHCAHSRHSQLFLGKPFTMPEYCFLTFTTLKYQDISIFTDYIFIPHINKETTSFNGTGEESITQSQSHQPTPSNIEAAITSRCLNATD